MTIAGKTSNRSDPALREITFHVYHRQRKIKRLPVWKRTFESNPASVSDFHLGDWTALQKNKPRQVDQDGGHHNSPVLSYRFVTPHHQGCANYFWKRISIRLDGLPSHVSYISTMCLTKARQHTWSGTTCTFHISITSRKLFRSPGIGHLWL